jgi:DNA polymerase (family X)
LKLAAKRSLPELVGDEDLHGILHSHTTASDGTETLEIMAEATRKRGFEYFGVADHSISAHYAGGLSLDEIAEQHREAEKLNKRYGKSFRTSCMRMALLTAIAAFAPSAMAIATSRTSRDTSPAT